MSFRITGSRGFHITFENGVTVSVQFGGSNYCQHHDDFELTRKERERHSLESYAAEVAVWTSGGKWITREYYPGESEKYAVEGWKTPDEVLALLNWAARYEEVNP